MILHNAHRKPAVLLRLRYACVHALPLLAAAILVLSSIDAHAQFNGPPSLPGQEINRPFTLTTDDAILHPPPQETVLQPGDTLNVTIYGDKDYTPTARISGNGTALMPLAGVIHFEGLTLTQASQVLAEKLDAAGMYRDPQVNMTSVDGPGQFITVIGEVHGTLPALGSRKLLEVLSAFGGLPATASHVITINRRGLADPIVVDVGNDPLNFRSRDIPVFAGDTIIISRIGVVYVLGAFRSTGIVALNSYGPLTLTELTAVSGGTQPVGKFDDLRIIRTIGNRRTVSVIDIKKVQNGKLPDPILQPNDIVYLPSSAFKSFFLGGTLNAVLSYVSLAISLESLR